MIEVKTVGIVGNPDALLNAAAVEGWELVAVTQGYFDSMGRYNAVGNTHYLKRERRLPPIDGKPKK
jgi:hypothetical protein